MFMKREPELREADIDGEAILKSIVARHGIFVEQAKDIYSFAHLSFQEYFTAKYIASNARQKTLERLMPQAAEDQWREAFLLTVSLLDDDVDEFFELFVTHIKGMSQASVLLRQLLGWANEKAKMASRVRVRGLRHRSI